MVNVVRSNSLELYYVYIVYNATGRTGQNGLRVHGRGKGSISVLSVWIQTKKLLQATMGKNGFILAASQSDALSVYTMLGNGQCCSNCHVQTVHPRIFGGVKQACCLY